jgi:cbb3-type cytochrome c oxidase subunit III
MKYLALALTASSVGALLAQQPTSDVTRNPLATSPTDAAAGARVYSQTCQSCHGPAGQGDRAPALTTSRFTHGNDDADVFHTIRTGIPGTQMPPFRGLSDQQIWQLVTYLRTLQASAPADRASAGDTAPPPGNAAAGEQLFVGKAACATCHEVNSRGGMKDT